MRPRPWWPIPVPASAAAAGVAKTLGKIVRADAVKVDARYRENSIEVVQHGDIFQQGAHQKPFVRLMIVRRLVGNIGIVGWPRTTARQAGRPSDSLPALAAVLRTIRQWPGRTGRGRRNQEELRRNLAASAQLGGRLRLSG